MANWKFKIDVKNEWQATNAGEMTIAAFAKIAADRLKALPVYTQESELFDIVDELETIAGDPEPEVEWFDNVWSNLYDWADQSYGYGKMCWIATF